MIPAEPPGMTVAAARILREIFGIYNIDDAIRWGVAQTSERFNVLMRGRQGEVWPAWQAFDAAGSVAMARTVLRGMDSTARRLFIVLVTHAVALGVQGDTAVFLEPSGRELSIPAWFVALIERAPM